LRKQLSVASDNQAFIAEAPIAMVISSDPLRAAGKYGERGQQLYAVQDATIAATYAQLAVVAAGLGSTWVGYFDDNAVRTIADISPELNPIAILSIGYPAELPEATPRRPLHEVVTTL
jgi:nitroreductase